MPKSPITLRRSEQVILAAFGLHWTASRHIQPHEMPHQLLKSDRKQAGPKIAGRTARSELWSPRMEEILGLNKRALDRARMSRDARFDGKFFIANTSTEIYCRPICPSPHARRRHVRYYPSAAAAAAAGYRPCLRCRPEAALGTPAWFGTSTVVRRALWLIDDGFLDQNSLDELAERLGIGSLHGPAVPATCGRSAGGDGANATAAIQSA